MCNGRFIVLTIFLLLAASLAPSISSAQEKNSTQLYPVKVNGKWGYINRQGKIVIQPQFDWAYEFHENIAKVEINGGTAYINRIGKIIPLKVALSYSPCSEGFCVFTVDHYKKKGFVSEDGQIVIEPRFTSAYLFSEGLAGVCEDKHCGFIDHAGNWVLPPIYQSAGVFVEGLANVVIDGKACFIDKQGKVVLRTVGNYAYHFSDGMAAFNKGGLIGFIDRTGKVVIEPQFRKAYSFKEGMAIIERGGRCGYIDKTGKVVVEMKYSHCSDFSEGLAHVWEDKDDFLSIIMSDWGAKYIDHQGKNVFNRYFGPAQDFHGGLGQVQLMVDPLFLVAREIIGYLSYELTGKKIDYPTSSFIKVGYIDKKGDYLWPPQN